MNMLLGQSREVILFSLLLFTTVFLISLLVFSFLKKKEKIAWLDIEKEKQKQKKIKTKIKFLEEAEKSGFKLSKEKYFALWLGAFLVGLAISFVFLNPLMMIIVLAVFWFSLKFYVFQREKKYRDTIKEQLGPSLQNLGAAFRTQKNWLRSLETVIPMLPSPIKEEFTYVKDGHQTGVAIGDAFHEMMERLRVPEMRLFVSMAQISEQVGEEVAEGIFAAGAYFQTRRIAIQDIQNAMMSALSENRMLVFGFMGIVFFFRFLQEDIFAGFIHTLIGKILLAIFIAVPVTCLAISYRIVQKEV